jgi:hypothetical protein
LAVEKDPHRDDILTELIVQAIGMRVLFVPEGIVAYSYVGKDRSFTHYPKEIPCFQLEQILLDIASAIEGIIGGHRSNVPRAFIMGIEHEFTIVEPISRSYPCQIPLDRIVGVELYIDIVVVGAYVELRFSKGVRCEE